MEVTLFGAALVILGIWAYVRNKRRGIKKMREEFEESARKDKEFRKVWEELNDLKSRMAKPGDVSRLIEKYESDLAKGEKAMKHTLTLPAAPFHCFHWEGRIYGRSEPKDCIFFTVAQCPWVFGLNLN